MFPPKDCDKDEMRVMVWRDDGKTDTQCLGMQGVIAQAFKNLGCKNGEVVADKVSTDASGSTVHTPYCKISANSFANHFWGEFWAVGARNTHDCEKDKTEGGITYYQCKSMLGQGRPTNIVYPAGVWYMAKCLSGNPITGACSCPSGTTGYAVASVAQESGGGVSVWDNSGALIGEGGLPLFIYNPAGYYDCRNNFMGCAFNVGVVAPSNPDSQSAVMTYCQ